MTWLLGIKLYALASLLFSVGWAAIGYRLHKRRELAAIKAEYRDWSSRVIQHHEIEPIQPIIRTWQ